MSKPCRLEINNSGSWKVIGRFDAADELHSDIVLDAAEKLILALNNGAEPRRCASLRISTDDGLGAVLMRWTAERGMWTDVMRGDPA